MNSFRVWIHPLLSDCRVKVDGIANARWLLTRLSQSFVFKTSEAIHDDEGASSSTFHLPYSSQTPRSVLERLMGAIPEVKLMSEPA
jgi:hypothetical protein